MAVEICYGGLPDSNSRERECRKLAWDDTYVPITDVQKFEHMCLPGKNNLKNPMPPKEKERKERRAKEKGSGAKMEKVMARITFRMQPQKVQLLQLPSQSQLPHQPSSQCANFPVSLRLRERKRFMIMFLNISQNMSSWRLLRVRRLTSHMR